MVDDAVVLHPGPMLRGMEIGCYLVADSPRATVDQVRNGVHVRMAVLFWLLVGTDPETTNRRTSERARIVADHRCPALRRRQPRRRPDRRRRDHRDRSRPGRTGRRRTFGRSQLGAVARFRRPAHPSARTRPRGHRDHRHRIGGSRAGGYTAVFAMANTTPSPTTRPSPTTYRTGREVGLVDDASGWVRSPSDLQGKQLAEMGMMAAGAAKVKMFSDDGKCVDDPLRRCAAPLEYAKRIFDVPHRPARRGTAPDGRCI